jgi:predicted RecA/RadA family phage recombinase
MSNILLSKSFQAAAAINAYTLVKHAAADDQVQAAAAGADLVIGATQDVAPAIGERVDIAMSGITYITAGAAIARGARLMSDASGRVITAAAAAGTNVNTVGVALEAATALGDQIRVSLNLGTFQG